MKKPSKARTIVILFLATVFIFLDIFFLFFAHDLLMAYHHDGVSIFPLDEIRIPGNTLWIIIAGAIFLSTFLSLLFSVLAAKSAVRNVFAE